MTFETGVHTMDRLTIAQISSAHIITPSRIALLRVYRLLSRVSGQLQGLAITVVPQNYE